MVRITLRQTTYWDIDADGQPIRVHFRGKHESRFVPGDSEGWAITSDHPVLLDHSMPWSQISLAGPYPDAAAVLQSISGSVSAFSDSWRSAAEYLNSSVPAHDLLNGGYGILLEAPQALVRHLSQVLDSFDVPYTVCRDERRPVDLRP